MMKNISLRRISFCFLTLGMVFSLSFVLVNALHAQDILSDNDFEKIQKMEGEAMPDNPAVRSILFTDQEYSALREARNYTGVARPLGSFDSFDNSEEEELELPPQEERYISLGGIAYNSGRTWTIWLNGQRVTPDSLPEDVLDLKVYKNYVEMRWYDKYTKRIMPIRLRANQRFHLDARIFLPG